MSGQMSLFDAEPDDAARDDFIQKNPTYTDLVAQPTGHTPKPTQAVRLLELLRLAGDGGITPMDALRHAECFRLAARIPEIRELIGPDEEVVNVGAITPTNKRIARYVLRHKENG